MAIKCKSQTTPYCQRDGVIAPYLNDIRKFQTLSKEDERSLLMGARSTVKEIRDYAITELVNRNQRFVLSVAMKLTNGTDLLDLVNEGTIGLITAIERFDLDKDVRFLTYATWWIQKSIKTYITEYRNAVTPANANKIRVTTTRVREDFFKKEHRMPTLKELQTILRDKYKFNVENLDELEHYQSIPIDGVIVGEEETYGENPLFSAATASNNIEDEIEKQDVKVIVSGLLKSLNERDKFIIEKIYGIGCTPQSYEDVANELQLTKERIRQKITEILKKLSKYVSVDVLPEDF